MHTMSLTESSHDTEKPCVGVCERSEDGRDDSDDRDRTVRERVLKEVGLTSSTFIGPAFPPQTTTTKSDIEDTLSEFYKELEEIDAPDGSGGDPLQPSLPLDMSTSKETRDGSQERNVNTSTYAETDECQKGSGHKQGSWPHWYHNEPYWPRRPRPGMDSSSGRAPPSQNHWHSPQTVNNCSQQPDLRFYRPSFHHPPPPPAFPNPQNPPSDENLSWSRADRCQSVSHSRPRWSTVAGLPPPNPSTRPSLGFYGGSPHGFDRDERCSFDTRLDDVNSRWSKDGEQEWCRSGEHYDRRQRHDSEKQQWEHHCQPPDSTNTYLPCMELVLMRGLPGSGKSTLARALLSTGPSGLILSTDDYFAHREGYRYEPGLLGAAHEWNQSRARDAMRDGRSPIIIDNTNIQAWEMKPYVKMALERGYRVDFCEPDTRWKFDPFELEKRNKHGVPHEKIAQMMDRFSFPVSIDIVMSSQEPPHVDQRRRPPMMRKSQDYY